jgi:hypothetical protein
MNIELWQKINSYVVNNQIDEAIKDLESSLASVESDRFKSLIGSEFKNSDIEIANEISKFISACEETFEVKSIYLEMNGFDINPDRWYFDLFAYDKYEEDEDELDWLSEWNSESWPEVTLIGLEEAQKDYNWYSNKSGYKDSMAQEAEGYAMLLVMVKFAYLIQKAIKTGKIEKQIPILATAHDFDIIPRFKA